MAHWQAVLAIYGIVMITIGVFGIIALIVWMTE